VSGVGCRSGRKSPLGLRVKCWMDIERALALLAHETGVEPCQALSEALRASAPAGTLALVLEAVKADSRQRRFQFRDGPDRIDSCPTSPSATPTLFP